MDQGKQLKDHLTVDDAFVRGDLDALKAALGHPSDFPNNRVPLELVMGDHVLEYAIYHSPVICIRQLLEMGAEPNYEDATGFPSLIATISSGRKDKAEIVVLLLSAGVDLQQRGGNDYTSLHDAVSHQDREMVVLLLSHGADLYVRTRIDGYATPLEEAEILGLAEMGTLPQNYGSSEP
jgi:ankyrin repeat protein